MLIPFISVTAIGLFIGLRQQSTGVGFSPVAGAGLAGAWAGFLAGALVGGFLDIFIIGGLWPTLLGHVGAVALARVASGNRARALLPG